MSRLLKASLISPIVVTLMLSFLIMTFFPDNLKKGEETDMFIAVISAGILLLTNFMTFFVGSFYYMYLKRKNMVSAFTIVGGGIGFGALVGYLFSVFLGYNPGMQMLINIGVYAMIGSALSSCIWHYGIRPHPQKQSKEPTE